jgi:DNA polymerase-3 subunit delta
MSSQSTALKPVYLILSEQELLVDRALTRLKKRLGDAVDLDFNMQVFSGENSDVADIVNACNTLLFASDLRLVVVRSVEKLSKESLEALVDYAGNPSPTTILALAGEKLAKNTRLYKAVEKAGDIVDRKLDKRDFPAMVRSMVGQHDKEISLDAAEQLVAAVGYDLRRLSAEVDKAVAYVGEAKEISREDISGVTSTTAPTTIWEFTEALGDRDCRRALAKTSDLIGEGESVFGLHAMALRTIRDLISVRSLLDRGHSSSVSIAKELGRPEWQIRRLVRQAKAFRAEELVDALRAAAAGEAQMKTSRDARLVLELWIVKVCSD